MEYQHRRPKVVGTAKKNTRLTYLGTSKPIKFSIPGINNQIFTIAPAVIKELSDPINIGNAFFQGLGKKIRCQLDFTNQSLKIGDMDTPLIRILNGNTNYLQPNSPEDTPEILKAVGLAKKVEKPNVIPLETADVTFVPGNSISFISVQTKPETAQQLEALEGKEILFDRARVEQGISAIYRWSKTSKVALCNSREETIQFPAGTELGYIQPFIRRTLEEKTITNEEPKGRLKELLDELKIEENEILGANPNLKERVISLITKYQDVFSSPD